MAFYKKVQIKTKDKDGHVQLKWYPRSVLVGNPITTDQVSKRIAQETTVAPADVKAVLSALSGVMGDYMAMGRSVKLEDIGSFYFTANAQGNGADTEKKCSVNQINGVKVHFIPETTYKRGGGGRQAVRALTDMDIEWVDIATLNTIPEADGDGDTPTPDPTPDPSGGDNTPSGDTGDMTITQVNGVNKSIGGNTTVTPSQTVTIAGTNMSGTWKIDGNIDPTSATASQVVFAALAEGTHTVTFNGSNVFTITCEEDQ